MSKTFRVTLLIVGSVAVLGGIFFIVTTMGMKDIRAYHISKIDLNTIVDGKYQGSCTISRWATTVKVTVKDHTIVSVEVANKMTSSSPDDLVQAIFQKMIEKQSPAIDAVSGGSITTKAYSIAVDDALNKAKKSL